MSSNNLTVTLATEDGFDVRAFTVRESVQNLFIVDVTLVSKNPDVDLDMIIGQPAELSVRTGELTCPVRAWKGVCNRFSEAQTEPDGLSTYQATIVPTLWLTSQRRNYRIFQLASEPEIVIKLLKEWQIEPVVRLDLRDFKKRKYRVQYAESDYAFMRRMLEDAGITFYFEQIEGETRLVLSAAPQKREPRTARIRFREGGMMTKSEELAWHVAIEQQVRPGKYTVRDHDYRRPADYKLLASAEDSIAPVEDKLERFHYRPGAFLFEAERGDDGTATADDRGRYRTNEREAEQLAQRRLEAKRSNARVVTFETNVMELAPGMVVGLLDHPRRDLGDDKDLLLVGSVVHGTATGEWSHHCEARSAENPYRPPLRVPKPHADVESATVVGPPGEEIFTDEFGRVRVHFHWDRESEMNDKSSCWIHVSQPWGGAGFGMSNLPRVGQEVLVDFLGGDPDRPIIVGRVFTNLQKTPYKLPEHKTKSGWRTNSTGGGGGHNEIMTEDKQGQEHLHIRAEKDLSKLVQNDMSVCVQRNRAVCIGGNESLFVGGDSNERVQGNKVLEVQTNLAQLVAGDIAVHSGGETIIRAETHAQLQANQGILIRSGRNYIQLSPGGITIQGVVVRINPMDANTTAVEPVPQDELMGFILDSPYQFARYVHDNADESHLPGRMLKWALGKVIPDRPYKDGPMLMSTYQGVLNGKTSESWVKMGHMKLGRHI